MTPERRYAAIVQEFLARPGVSHRDDTGSRKSFGSGTLQVSGGIFAMLVRGSFVVKLPRERVDALVAAGQGVHFDAGKGRPMKEWLVVAPGQEAQWHLLAEEAFTFAGR